MFFSRPSPKAGRELQTVSDTRRIMKNDGGSLARQSRSPGRESTQRQCVLVIIRCVKLSHDAIKSR